MADTNIRFVPNNLNKAQLSTIDILNGNVYFVQDTKEIFYDFNSNRIQIQDILILKSEANRISPLFVPLNKFYFVLDTKTLWYYNEGVWYQVSADIDLTEYYTKTEIDNLLSQQVNLEPDKQTIDFNTDNKIETIAIHTIDGTIKKEWIGTKAEYEQGILDGSITPETECKVTDELDEFVTIIPQLKWGNIIGDLSNQTDLKEELDAKANNDNVVHITGDETIGGNKNFINMVTIHPTNSYSSPLSISHMAPERGVAPSSNVYFGIQLQDKNFQRMGMLEHTNTTDGISTTGINELRVVNGTNTYAKIQVGFDANNKAYTNATPSDVINSIITTTGISKSTNGYLKLGNGIILQWGKVTYSATRDNNTTVTLPTPFTTTNYSVQITAYNTTGTALGPTLGYNLTTSTFKGRLYGHGNSDSPIGWQWFAIGY